MVTGEERMSELDVQVELRLKNNLSKEAAAALKAMGREAKAAGDAVDKAGKSGGGELAREADDAARAYRETARGTGYGAGGTSGGRSGAGFCAGACFRPQRRVRHCTGRKSDQPQSWPPF